MRTGWQHLPSQQLAWKSFELCSRKSATAYDQVNIIRVLDLVLVDRHVTVHHIVSTVGIPHRNVYKLLTSELPMTTVSKMGAKTSNRGANAGMVHAVLRQTMIFWSWLYSLICTCWSSSSAFPTTSLGFTIFGEIFAYVTVFLKIQP